jgi:hypothetical protein
VGNGSWIISGSVVEFTVLPEWKGVQAEVGGRTSHRNLLIVFSKKKTEHRITIRTIGFLNFVHRPVF